MSDDAPGIFNSENQKLSALRILDEKQFVNIVNMAFARHRGVVTKAAKGLHVHRNTLGRWVEEYPAIKNELDRIREMYATEEE